MITHEALSLLRRASPIQRKGIRMTKKIMFSSILVLCALVSFREASALDNGGGGPGGGDPSYDCNGCQLHGGWGPGMTWWECVQMRNGNGGGCQALKDGCHYTRGCVSLPTEVDPGGYIP